MKIAYSILCLLLISVISFSAPYFGQLRSFSQPDGTEVQVRLFGDEHYIRAESLDGYTLVRDDKTGWINYAILSPDSSDLLPSGIIYTGNSKSSFRIEDTLITVKHLDISSASRLRITEKNRQRFYSGATRPIEGNKRMEMNEPAPLLSGKIKGLTIIIDFSDNPSTLPVSEYDNLWNSMTYANYGCNGSVKKYYYDVSGGIMEYENAVFGIFRAPKTFAEYDNMDYTDGAKQILDLALNWVKAKGFDFSTLTTDGNGNIKAINMMYTGSPKTWAKGMWHHAGFYNLFSANGVRTGKYNCSGANAPLGIGTACHENGHMICGWPDTYKYDSNTGPDGIGTFDLMCYYGAEENPVPPNPFFLSNIGWAAITGVNGFNGVKSDVSNDLNLYKYSNPSNAKEYYLFQNVIKSGRGKSYPDQGLTIWHIDEAGDNQTAHPKVFLVHAGNDISNHQNACWESSYKSEFSDATIPSAKWYDGSISSLKCFEISPIGNTMTYKFGTGITAIQEPYNGTPIPIPGTIEAENYDNGGEGISYQDSDGTNQGNIYRIDGVDIDVVPGAGFALGWTAAGEWTEYSIDVKNAGSYDFEFKVSSMAGGGILSIEVDGNIVFSNVTIPKTSDWTVYTTFVKTGLLPVGKHVLRLKIIQPGFNVDRIVLKKATVTGFDTYFQQDEFSVYPNPSNNGVFYLSETLAWQVFNLFGQRILEGNGQSVDLSSFPNDIYLVKVGNTYYKLMFD